MPSKCERCWENLRKRAKYDLFTCIHGLKVRHALCQTSVLYVLTESGLIVRMELRGCDCERALHCTAVNKSVNLEPLWTSTPSPHQCQQWSMRSSKCSTQRTQQVCGEGTTTDPTHSSSCSPIIPWINVPHKLDTSIPLLETSLSVLVSTISICPEYRFLSISGVLRQRTLSQRSKEPDTKR